MAITPSDFSKIWASNADTPEYTFNEADYLKGWDFVGNLPPTRAMWNAMQKSTDEKMKYVFDNFGAPLTASTVAGMTMQNRVYVYTGSETGYTAGHWYYWNGSAWTDGGVYNAVVVQTDATLTQAGVPADAKATGKSIQAIYDGKERILLTTSPGFINVDGTISSPTANKEVYTNKIPVSPGDVLDLSLEYGSSHSMWLAVARYDSTNTFVTRSYIVSSITQATYNGQYTVPIDTSYIAFTYRTFDDATFSVMRDLVDETLSISGRPADAKVTGDNIFYIEDDMGISLPITKTITTSGGTISTGASSIMFNAKEGEVLKYKISGDIFTASSTVNIYLYKGDGTISSAIPTWVNDEISMILPHDITGTALRLTNLNAGSLEFTVQRVLPNNKIAQIEQNTANIDAIQDGYVYNGNPVTIDGSITATGVYRNPSSVYKDVITNPYKIYPGIVFDIDITLNNGQAAFWLGYAEYDANNNFLRRVVVANSAMSRFQGSVPINDADASYVRFLYRTFGSATAIIKAQLGFVKELDDKIDNMDTSVVLPSVTVPNIAHRGDGILAPQCTAPAYIAAKKRGFSIAENDLFYSQDGVLVMWHDTTLALLGNMVDINGYLMYTDGTNYYWVHPTTNAVYTWGGNDYVASAVDLATLTRCNGSNYSVNNQYEPNTIGLNFDILRRIDFGVWKGQQFAGTQILTFEEWILLCKQLGMGAYVDRKLTYTDEIITEAANTVKRLGMSDYTSWLGVYAAQINKLRTIIPHARCGVLTHPTAQNVISYAPYNVDGKFFFNGDARNGMTAGAIHTGLDAGFEVEVWYVEYGATSEEQILAKIREAVSYGVTGITLDHYRTNDAFAYLLE